MSQTFHFYAGMPRSGGTVLASILSQNPYVHVTSNTALYDVLNAANKAWRHAPTVISHPMHEQRANMNRAIINSMWAHCQKPIVIDRNRSWAHAMPISRKWFEKDIKVIASIRDIPGIITSWVTLYKRETGDHSQAGTERIANEMWDTFTKEFTETFVKLKREAGDRVLFFEYDDITSNPRYHLSQIEDFLDLPKFEYDLENIKGDFQDRNIVPGGLKGIHRIRPKYEKVSVPPEEELGSKLFERFQELNEKFRSEMAI
jgi:sulfotransferase